MPEDLAGEDLSGKDLTNADLTGANLTRADLTRAHPGNHSFEFLSIYFLKIRIIYYRRLV